MRRPWPSYSSSRSWRPLPSYLATRLSEPRCSASMNHGRCRFRATLDDLQGHRTHGAPNTRSAETPGPSGGGDEQLWASTERGGHGQHPEKTTAPPHRSRHVRAVTHMRRPSSRQKELRPVAAAPSTRSDVRAGSGEVREGARRSGSVSPRSARSRSPRGAAAGSGVAGPHPASMRITAVVVASPTRCGAWPRGARSAREILALAEHEDPDARTLRRQSIVSIFRRGCSVAVVALVVEHTATVQHVQRAATLDIDEELRAGAARSDLHRAATPAHA